MALLVKRHKRTGKWKFWTTISDGWLTDWLSTDEAKEYLRDRGSRDAGTFPQGWYDIDTWELGAWNTLPSKCLRMSGSSPPPQQDQTPSRTETPPNILAGELGCVTEYRINKQWDSHTVLTLTIQMNKRGIEEFGRWYERGEWLHGANE